jgi:hypothetical protein
MNTNNLKRKRLAKRIFINAFMSVAVLVIVTVITLLMLGFRFDANKGSLEQNAFLQFDSTPSGATVSIDGVVSGSNTPSKNSVPAGRHKIVMWRDGYQTWQKTVNLGPGTLTWLNYTLLVPKSLPIESVANYKSIYSTLASPSGRYMLVQPESNSPTFNLIDLSSDTIKSTNISIPSNVYTQPTTTSGVNTFKPIAWDGGERYVIVSHTYGAKTEWIVLDTQDITASKNVTQLFDLGISKIVFSDNSGNNLYALDSGDIRKLDLNAGTISKPLVSNVTSFDFYNGTKVITYVGNGKSGTTQRVLGIFREGDDSPAVIRTVNTSSSVPLNIATAFYFNENYVAVSQGNQVDIMSGSYPNTTSDNTNSLKVVASFKTKQDINNLSFSPAGQYVLAQSGANFASYDLEYQKLSESTIKSVGMVSPLMWLDGNHIWSDADGTLTIRDFDGANVYTINPVLVGQGVTLTNNGRFLYSVNKNPKGFQLQRVRMILP